MKCLSQLKKAKSKTKTLQMHKQNKHKKNSSEQVFKAKA